MKTKEDLLKQQILFFFLSDGLMPRCQSLLTMPLMAMISSRGSSSVP